MKKINNNGGSNIKLVLGIIALLAICTGLLFIISLLMKDMNGESIENGPAVTSVASNGDNAQSGKDNKSGNTDTTQPGKNGSDDKSGNSGSDTTQSGNEGSKDSQSGNTGSDDPAKNPTSVPTATPTSTPTPTPKDVEFSHKDYLYSEDINVEITDTTGKSGSIRYTLDGSTPDKNSAVYSAPILIQADSDDYPNCVTIRAKSFYNDGTESKEFVHSYLVNTNINERFSTLVMVISGEPSELNEAPNGILTGTNYKQRGSDSERVVHIEAFDADGNEYFSMYAGARVYGGTSREHCIKSLKLYARKKYDDENTKFTLNVFDTRDPEGKKVKKYDRLVLRNGGDDFQGAFLREELMQELAQQAGLDFTERAVPAVAFVNGEYYGYYWLHQNYCDDYFQRVCGKAEGEYFVFEQTEKSLSGGGTQIENEVAYRYNKFYSTYSKADLTKAENFAEVEKIIDVENYLDYMAFNIYLDNYDWPQGNVKVMCYYSPTGDYEPGTYRDGRFYFLVHDSDIGTGCYGKGDICDADNDDIERVTNSKNSHYSALLTSLLKREDCREYFIAKLRSLAANEFSLDNVNAKLDELLAMREEELPYYINHLRSLKDAGIWCTMNSVNNDVETIRTFVKRRPEFMEKFIKNYFGE